MILTNNFKVKKEFKQEIIKIIDDIGLYTVELKDNYINIQSDDYNTIDYFVILYDINNNFVTGYDEREVSLDDVIMEYNRTFKKSYKKNNIKLKRLYNVINEKLEQRSKLIVYQN